MQISTRKGFSFGLTSGIITTLGMIVGLHSGTHSKLVVLGGILIITVADALSDALGIHISEESEGQHSNRAIWKSTISTFLSKFVVAATFIIPIILLSLNAAIIASIIWGLSLICIASYFIARVNKMKPSKVILEHLMISVAVVIITHFLGDIVGVICA